MGPFPIRISSNHSNDSSVPNSSCLFRLLDVSAFMFALTVSTKVLLAEASLLVLCHLLVEVGWSLLGGKDVTDPFCSLVTLYSSIALLTPSSDDCESVMFFYFLPDSGRLGRRVPRMTPNVEMFRGRLYLITDEPLSVILQLEPKKLVRPANIPTSRDARVSPPAKESTVTPAFESLELSANVVPASFAIASEPKAVFSVVKENKRNAVKALACWVWRPNHKVLDHGNPQQDLKDKGVIDSGCSRHMTGNRSLQIMKKLMEDLLPLEAIPKEGKLLGSRIRLDFKLTDENHVLLKVPRKVNMYSVDLKNVVSQGGLTCLFAKVTLDKSNLWYRRLGHVNFKTMNKLVRGNLVRGLPSKLFKINQTCVACQKGKQHRASCKTKTVSSISQPLQMLHMDLFGPTFIKSLMKNMYCLVVTDDFSRFSWVFFLATKDETSEILKTFITGIENLIDLKVKVIRCDNETEFKNRVMNQFCKMKGIKREFSVARTPQQNRAEAVNTACYVQNRVLVIKPHNKTPYELFLGRKLALSFMRPFGCPVTILNTIDHLGKFDGKADEGLFVGYSTNSKAFREVDLIGLFNIDALTKSMNYKPVVAGNQSNGNAGTKACDDVGKARVETVPGKDYILLLLWTQDLPFSSNSKDSSDAGFKPSGEEEMKDAEDPGNEDSEVSSTEEPRVNQEKDVNVNNTNTVNNDSLTVKAAGIEDNAIDENIVYGCADDLNIHELEDIVYSNDDEDVGAEADMNNLDAFMPVSPIPTTKIHIDHPVDKLIGDLHSNTQTRRMDKEFGKNMVVSSVQQRTNHKDFQNYLTNGKRAIGTKWVYRNKKDERGIVIKNKARLVAQGYTQEEGIDYDEVFASVARIEVIRLFIAYASCKDFVVYQMDVKSAFLYGKIEEKVYICQPLGFEDPDFPERER
ncbi:putative ribonuclease H-like domain-containing protein [Tanacetum coccineum]